MEDLISIKALPCDCRLTCKLTKGSMKNCPCHIARASKAVVAFFFCEKCGKMTWHIGCDCVKCRERVFNG